MLLLMTVTMPSATLADLRGANEPPPPRTARDAYNATVGYVEQLVLFAIAATALTWLVWWSIRQPRK